MSTAQKRLESLSPQQRALFDLLAKRNLARVETRERIVRRSRESDTFPLSFSQRRLWFLDRLQPNSPLYNLPAGVRLSGRLDVNVLRRSLSEVISRHEILRTTFHSADGEPVQVIAPHYDLSFPVVDLSGFTYEEAEKEVERLATADYLLPFDLSRLPLVRAALLKLNDTEHVLLFTLHHIICDGWSINVLMREVAALYHAFLTEDRSPLPELAIQYADFAQWQREYLSGDVLDEHLTYWKGSLAGGEMQQGFSASFSPDDERSISGAYYSFVIPKSLSDSLRDMSRQEGVTMFMLLLAAFSTLLRRYTGLESINVGSAIANRNRAETEGLIGMFVNTLVLKVDMSGDPTFRELLQRVRSVTLSGYEHQDLPFERLVEELNPQRNMNQNPLFQVGFTTDYERQQTLDIPGFSLPDLVVTPLNIDRGTAKLDLSLDMSETGQDLVGLFGYRTDLFDADTIERMATHFHNLLKSIDSNPSQTISQLEILSDDERKKITVEWNDTEADFPQHLCFQHLFERHASSNPDAVAVCCQEHLLTYSELETFSNQLANRLVKLGVGPEVTVALFMRRSPELLIAILGVAKAGGVYLPIDISQPKERVAYMLEDAEARVIITQLEVERMLPDSECDVVRIDSFWEYLSEERSSPPRVKIDGANLAYIIYTSGTTGKPKGVMITHRGLMNYLESSRQTYYDGEVEGGLVHTSIGFDLTVTSLLVPLIAGKRVEIVREEDGIEGLIEKVSAADDKLLLNLTPAHMDIVNERLEGEQNGSNRTLVVGGEALKWESVRRWKKREPRGRIINEYGPTETVVGSSIHEAEAIEVAQAVRGEVAIGRPIGNMRMYVLDERMEVMPAGVAGEIYIAGAGVGRGYVKRAEETADRFVPEALGGREGARMYRTGDKGRYRLDGVIEYLGREDEQVKVRGYRIELGEVEAVLREESGVEEAVVVVRGAEDGDKRLVGYVVRADGEQKDWVEVRERMRRRLPEYMMPWEVVEIGEMPLTPNGKIDRRALIALDSSRNVFADKYEPPRTSTEIELAGLWQEVLRVDRVGINDNFFWLGGHSLLLTQLASRITKSFFVELPLRTLFNGPTIAEMAAAIEAALIEQVDPAELAGMFKELEHV